MMQRASPSSPLELYRPLFEPETVAVVGASATSINSGNRFIKTLRANGFAGEIYPIHPKAKTIDGLPTFGSISETPRDVDYAFVAISAPQVIPFLKEAAGRLRFAQVMSSGFGETSHGAALEAELVRVARHSRVRVIGPNCIGLHSPRGKLALVDGNMQADGGIGFLSQSGGLTLDVLRRGRSLGLKFSAAVSLGNCVDIGPNDILEYFLADRNTKVIGMYLEHVRRGRFLFEQLKTANARKPVIILKSGRTRQGQRAAAAHTGSLIDDDRIWDAMIRQTGSIRVDDLDDLTNMFIGFQFYTPGGRAPMKDVILFGNGGGISVIAADQFACQGLNIVALNPELANSLEGLGLPDGASIANPIDVPANILIRDKGETGCRIMQAIRDQGNGTTLVIHLNLPVIAGYGQNEMLKNLIDGAVCIQGDGARVSTLQMVLRSDGDPATEKLKAEIRSQANQAGIPVLDELRDAARVLGAQYAYDTFRHRRSAAAAGPSTPTL